MENWSVKFLKSFFLSSWETSNPHLKTLKKPYWDANSCFANSILFALFFENNSIYRFLRDHSKRELLGPLTRFYYAINGKNNYTFSKTGKNDKQTSAYQFRDLLPNRNFADGTQMDSTEFIEDLFQQYLTKRAYLHKNTESSIFNNRPMFNILIFTPDNYEKNFQTSLKQARCDENHNLKLKLEAIEEGSRIDYEYNFDFQRFPYLILTINRVPPLEREGQGQKDSSPIDFIYDICGLTLRVIVRHSEDDSTRTGHYVCIFKWNGEWYEMNDLSGIKKNAEPNKDDTLKKNCVMLISAAD